MSLLADTNDIEALACGFASVNITVRDKSVLFNHTDKIFSEGKILTADKWNEGER